MRIAPMMFSLLLAAPLACADGGSLPLPTEAVPLRADFMNNTDVSSPKVIRFDGRDGWLINDAASGLFSIISVSNGEFGCAQRTYRTLDHVQMIMQNPDDPESAAVQTLILGQDIYITVYTGPFDESLTCADLAARKVAQGFGRWTFTDNDFFSYLHPGHNADAFGITAQGSLDLLAGGTARYSAVQRCSWDGEDFATVKCIERVNLQ